MADTTLSIRADSRQIGVVTRALRTFKLEGVRASLGIRREMRSLNREVRELEKEQKRLTSSLLGVKKGTDEYKRLTAQLGATRQALKGAMADHGRLQSAMGRGSVARRGAGRVGRGIRGTGGAAVATGAQTLGTVGGAGPEQTFGTMGALSGGLSQAVAGIPVIGPLLAFRGAMAQAGLNVMQRRASLYLGAEKARQGAGAFIKKVGLSTSQLDLFAKHGYSPEEAFGTMRGFGAAMGVKAGSGVLPFARAGFGPGAFAGAQLYAPGGSAATRTTGGRFKAGKMLLRQVASMIKQEELSYGGSSGAGITPATVEERLTRMVGYLKQLSEDGVQIDPMAFGRMTMAISMIGSQNIRGVSRQAFAGHRALRFQQRMRESQKQEGGLMNMLAVMGGMRQGMSIFQALERAEWGGVGADEMQRNMRSLFGSGESPVADYMIAKAARVRMQQASGFRRGDLTGGGIMSGKQAFAGLRTAPGKRNREMLRIRAEETAKGGRNMDSFVKMAKQLQGIQDHLAKNAVKMHNDIMDNFQAGVDLLKGMLKVVNKISAFVGGPQVNVSNVTGPTGPSKLKFCWVARVVIPERWALARVWIVFGAPRWFRFLYCWLGPAFAEWLKDEPRCRNALRPYFTAMADAGEAMLLCS